MCRRAREWSAIEVRRVSKPGTYAVGGVAGLYLVYRSESARSWILRAPISLAIVDKEATRGRKQDAGDGGKPQEFRPPCRAERADVKVCDIGLGPFPEISLEAARARALEAKKDIARGIDPRAAKREARRKAQAEAAKRLLFRDAARQCWQSKSEEFTSAKHKAQWIGTLEKYAFKKLGDLEVQEITRAHVLQALEPIWTKITDTASKLRGRIESVIAYGYAVLEIQNRLNPAAWDNGLDAILPSAQKIIRQNETHHPALPWERMGELMEMLGTRGGLGARALEFQLLTTSRSIEVRGAKWSEINFAKKEWKVPACRMKGKKIHTVPLCDEAISLLRALPRMAGCDFIFWSSRGTALSDATLSKVIKDMHSVEVKAGRIGFTDPNENDRVATPHGTARSSFKDWARNQPGHNDDVTELQIAHVNSDSTRAAYARDELLELRRPLVQQWATFCYTPPRKPAPIANISAAQSMTNAMAA